MNYVWEIKAVSANSRMRHMKSYSKIRPRTGHEGPERDYSFSSTLSLTSALDGVGVNATTLKTIGRRQNEGFLSDTCLFSMYCKLLTENKFSICTTETLYYLIFNHMLKVLLRQCGMERMLGLYYR